MASTTRLLRRSGQSLVETLLASIAVLLALFGLLQVALAAGARETLRHAAARAARARAVGMNDWMAEKAARVAGIPVSGRRTAPSADEAGGAGGAMPLELSRIPSYLGAETRGRASWILSYEEWERGRPAVSFSDSPFGGGALRASASMDYPLSMPFAGFFVPFAKRDETGVRRLPVSATASAPNQSGLYLSDRP